MQTMPGELPGLENGIRLKKKRCLITEGKALNWFLHGFHHVTEIVAQRPPLAKHPAPEGSEGFGNLTDRNIILK